MLMAVEHCVGNAHLHFSWLVFRVAIDATSLIGTLPLWIYTLCSYKFYVHYACMPKMKSNMNEFEVSTNFSLTRQFSTLSPSPSPQCKCICDKRLADDLGQINSEYIMVRGSREVNTGANRLFSPSMR